MVTKKECIESLQEAAEMLGHSPTHLEYVDLGLSPGTTSIIDAFGSWNEAKEKANIETYRANDEKFGYFRTTTQGYEEISFNGPEGRERVKIHRLIAVAEYGLDKVVDKDIHHKSNIGWDNRPKNIVPLTHSEHSKITNS